MNQTNLYQYLIEFTSLNGTYTIPALGVVGFITNLICFFIFFSPKFGDKYKFKYLIVKILIEMFACLYSIGFQNYLLCLLEPHVISRTDCVPTGTILFQIIRLYVYKYASYSFYVWSGINEVLINYDRYLVLKNKRNMFNKEKQFIYIALVSGLVSFSLFVPNLFAYYIKPALNKTNSYTIERTSFGRTDFFQLYVLAVLTVSNIVSTILLIITSFLLLFEFRKFTTNLSGLTKTKRSRQEILRKKIEIKMIKMVLLMSIMFTTLRLSDFVYTLNNSLFLLKLANNIDFFVYFTNFWYISGTLLINTNIFVLVKFNNKFRNIFIHYTKINTFTNWSSRNSAT